MTWIGTVLQLTKGLPTSTCFQTPLISSTSTLAIGFKPRPSGAAAVVVVGGTVDDAPGGPVVDGRAGTWLG